MAYGPKYVYKWLNPLLNHGLDGVFNMNWGWDYDPSLLYTVQICGADVARLCSARVGFQEAVLCNSECQLKPVIIEMSLIFLPSWESKKDLERLYIRNVFRVHPIFETSLSCSPFEWKCGRQHRAGPQSHRVLGEVRRSLRLTMMAFSNSTWASRKLRIAQMYNIEPIHNTYIDIAL